MTRVSVCACFPLGSRERAFLPSGSMRLGFKRETPASGLHRQLRGISGFFAGDNSFACQSGATRWTSTRSDPCLSAWTCAFLFVGGSTVLNSFASSSACQAATSGSFSSKCYFLTALLATSAGGRQGSSCHGGRTSVAVGSYGLLRCSGRTSWMRSLTVHV